MDESHDGGWRLTHLGRLLGHASRRFDERVLYLMAHDVQAMLGYHGFELRYYDELMGGKNEWRNVGSPNLHDLLAVRYLLLPDSQTVPGFHRVLGPAPTTSVKLARPMPISRPSSRARVCSARSSA